MRRQRKAFTLIELLIVVVILGILASIAIVKFANSKEKAYLASMKSDLRNLVTSEEAYFSDNNSSYATSVAALGTYYLPSAGVTVTVSNVTNTGWSASATHSQTAKSCAITLAGGSTVDGAIICQ